MDYETRTRDQRFELLDPLAGINLQPNQRRRAQNAMHDADMVVSLLIRLVDDINAMVSTAHAAWTRLTARIDARLGRVRDGMDLEREAFLSQSVDVADLERRIHVFEQRAQSLAGWPHPTA